MGLVSVTCFGKLKKQISEKKNIAPGQSVADAIKVLQLEYSGELPLTAVVNSQVVTWDYILLPDDKLELVPTIGGG